MSFMIDDFASGHDTIVAGPGPFPTQYKAGSMLGKWRQVTVNNAVHPRNQPAILDVGSADRLNLTLGLGASARIDIGYGVLPGGEPASLGVDLNQQGDRFRINFSRLSLPNNMNFTIQVFTGAGHWLLGQPIVPNPRLSFDLLFSDFRLGGSDGRAGGDFSDVMGINCIYDAWHDLAIDSFEVV